MLRQASSIPTFRPEDMCILSLKFVLFISSLTIFISGLLILILGIVTTFIIFINQIENEPTGELVIILIKKYTSYAFIALGLLFISASTFGVYALYYLNKRCLKIQLLITSVILFIHLFALIFFLCVSPYFKKDVETSVNNLVHSINSLDASRANIDKLKKQCDSMLAISDILSCCGATSPKNFNSPNLTEVCCSAQKHKIVEQMVGCSSAIIDRLKYYVLSFIIIPNGVLLSAESVNLLLMSCLLFAIRKEIKYKDVPVL